MEDKGPFLSPSTGDKNGKQERYDQKRKRTQDNQTMVLRPLLETNWSSLENGGGFASHQKKETIKLEIGFRCR